MQNAPYAETVASFALPETNWEWGPTELDALDYTHEAYEDALHAFETTLLADTAPLFGPVAARGRRAGQPHHLHTSTRATSGNTVVFTWKDVANHIANNPLPTANRARPTY